MNTKSNLELLYSYVDVYAETPICECFDICAFTLFLLEKEMSANRVLAQPKSEWVVGDKIMRMIRVSRRCVFFFCFSKCKLCRTATENKRATNKKMSSPYCMKKKNQLQCRREKKSRQINKIKPHT